MRHLNILIIALSIYLQGCGTTELSSSENVEPFAHLVHTYLDNKKYKDPTENPRSQ